MSRSEFSTVSTDVPPKRILSTKYATIPRTYKSRYIVPIITFTVSFVPAAKNIMIATMNGGTINIQSPMLKSIMQNTTGSMSMLNISVTSSRLEKSISPIKTTLSTTYTVKNDFSLPAANSRSYRNVA